ncbi:MAG: HDOD domain-containing protein, partial [Phycisphaerae bacterium]|nr:HDOD domain-containing protein [Phycisphaerae bacterium]
MSDVPVVANVQALLERIDTLPSPSALALRLVTTANDETSDVRDLVAIIQQDAALAAKVLSLCRRGPRGRALDVASLDRAVVLLGFGAVRAAALAVEFIGSFPASGAMATSGFDSMRFWRHSVAKSIVAEAASKFVRGAPGAGRPSVVGLLHDLGALALSRALPALCDRCCDEAERLGRDFDDVVADAVGLSASAIGGRVAARWSLPDEITESLRMRGALALAAQGPHRPLVLLAQLADIVVRQRHVGGAGFGPGAEPLPPLFDALAIDATRFAAAVASLFDDLAARTEALGFASPPGAALAAESLDRANRRLGLARHNPDATFADISDELAAATDPASVLSCIVRQIGRQDGRPADADARVLAVSPAAEGPGCEVREFSRDGALVASRIAGEGDLDGAVTVRRWCQLRAPTGTPRHLAVAQRGATLVTLYRADGDVIPLTVLDQMPVAIWAFALGAALDRERARRAAQRSADAARLLAACRDKIAKDRALAS